MDALLIILLIILLLPLIGFAYEQVGTWRDRQRFSPPGEMVQVNDHSLHVLRAGEEHEAPWVVLESGIGGSSVDWSLVLPEVARFAPVLAYDRAGVSYSQSTNQKRSPDQMVEELHTVLERLDIPRPIVLVGHSFGGLFARLFAARYPQEAAGLILVDASHPEMLKDRDIEEEVKRLRQVHRFKQVGLLRLVLDRVMRNRIGGLPPEKRREYIMTNLHNTRIVIDEALATFERGFDDLPEHLGELPVIVLSRSPMDTTSGERWQSFQEKLTSLSDHLIHINTDKGNHYIQFEEPGQIVEAIGQMIQVIRGQGRLVQPVEGAAAAATTDGLTEAPGIAEGDSEEAQEVNEEAGIDDDTTGPRTPSA